MNVTPKDSRTPAKRKHIARKQRLESIIKGKTTATRQEGMSGPLDIYSVDYKGYLYNDSVKPKETSNSTISSYSQHDASDLCIQLCANRSYSRRRKGLYQFIDSSELVSLQNKYKQLERMQHDRTPIGKFVNLHRGCTIGNLGNASFQKESSGHGLVDRHIQTSKSWVYGGSILSKYEATRTQLSSWKLCESLQTCRKMLEKLEQLENNMSDSYRRLRTQQDWCEQFMQRDAQGAHESQNVPQLSR